MRTAAVGAAAILLGCLVAGCGGPHHTSLLLITMDTTRADHLGCYGHDRPTSPNLDRLAAEGVLFREVIAQASVTPVSHASILTGLNPPRHGLRALHGFNDLMLDESVRTLAQILGDRGYATAGFISAFPASSRFGLDRGFTHFDEAFLDRVDTPILDADGMVNTRLAQRRADETTDPALAWLQTHAGQPFFMWVHYFDPHDPYLVPPQSYLDYCEVRPGSTPQDLIDLYDCEIYFMDAEIGRLLARLGQLGIADRTLVAVTADHGEGLGDHDWWSHGILYHEQIRLPLILRHPDLPPGRTVPARIRSIDIAPTVLDLLGVDPAPEGFDGRSARAEMTAEGGAADRTAYAESRNLVSYAVPHAPGSFDRKDDELYCLVRDGWKLVHHRFRPEDSQLFDLGSDPGERDNRYAAEPAIARRLLEQLQSQQGIFDPGTPTPPPPDLMERMRSLGYVDR